MLWISHCPTIPMLPGTLHQRHKELLQRHGASSQRIGQMLHRDVADLVAHAYAKPLMDDPWVMLGSTKKIHWLPEIITQ